LSSVIQAVPGIDASRDSVDVMVLGEAIPGLGAAEAWVARRAVVAAKPAVASKAAVRRTGFDFTVGLLTMKDALGAGASLTQP